MLSMFMAAVEVTIVATAMPTILAELGGFHLLTWVFGAFLLAQAVTVPLYGKLADVFGRKPVFYFGTSVFLIASVLAGFSANMLQLILFRALQGLGGGALMPIAITIVGDIYTPHERARVQGYLASVWGVSSVIGPVLGALFVQQLHWALVFWVNLPVGIAAMAILALFHHEHVEHKGHRVDYPGAVLLMAGTAAWMLALIQGHALDTAPLIGLYAAGALCMAAFVVQERRAAEPMMPLDLWRQRVIVVGNLGGLMTGALMIGVISFLPTFVQGVMGRSATVAGFALTAISIGWPIAATIGGRVMVHTSYRFVAGFGGVFMVVGSAVLWSLGPLDGPLWAAAGAFLLGAGLGLSSTAFMVSIQSSVGWGQRGVATSTNMFMRIAGQALGAAVFGAVINYGLANTGTEHESIDRLMEPAMRATLATADLSALTEILAAALHNVYAIGLALAIVTLGISLAIPRGLKP
jgi:EmrB/QacA subfamily drug resistance transporter